MRSLVIPAFSETDFASAWLDRFDPEERSVAARLVDEIVLVNRDDLSRGLVDLLDGIMARSDESRPLALFAERAVKATAGVIDPFWPGTASGRAVGDSVPPVAPEDQEVGSEGAIANLITSYARLHRHLALSHPGPDQMRSSRVGPVVIVTDFVGSGKRVSEMLDAFASVASLQSWRSYGYIDFHVAAYSGTAEGLDTVRRHHLRPRVEIVAGCPTVHDVFRGEKIEQVRSLCSRHPGKMKWPFGFRNGGALIAFAHGMPNNAPYILHSSQRSWTPLFRNRSTLGADYHFPLDTVEQVLERAQALLKIKAARSRLDDPRSEQWIKTMLVLAALEDGARAEQQVSAITRLALHSVQEILGFLVIARWASKRGRLMSLTRLGSQELLRLRQRRRRTPVLPTASVPFYFPTQLRSR